MSSSDPRRKRNPNAGTLVVRDPNKGGRSNQRRPPPNGQRRQRGAPPPQRRGDPQWQDPDDVSEVSEAEYEQDYEEPRFKYSTAELRNASCVRNQRCCIASVIVVCIIVAIIVSVVYKKISDNLDEEANKIPTDPPTMAPSLAPSLSIAPTVTPGRLLRHNGY